MAGSSTNISLILPVITDATIVRDIYNLNWNTIDGRFSATYLAIQAKNAVSITGGSITGITDLAVADGGTGSSTASAARTALGVAIGSDIQAYDAGLLSIAGLTTGANKMIYTTALDTYAIMDTFAELQAVVADKTLINEEDAITLDSKLTLAVSGDDALSISMTSITGTDNQAIDVIGGEALGAEEHWTGIRVKPDNLDPSGINTRIRGLAINLSGITFSEANTPDNICGIRIKMPSGLSGLARSNTEALYISEGDIEHIFTVPNTATSHFTAYDMVLDASLLVSTSAIHALDFTVAGGDPSGDVCAIGTHTYVSPICQWIGTYSTPSQTEYAGEKTGGGNNWVDGIDLSEIFVANSDEIYVGSTSQFSEIEVIFGTAATKTVGPTFWYNTAADAWTQFYPSDATNGFQNGGLISWTLASITATWTSNGDPGGDSASSGYWIKIIRTSAPDPGTPTPTTVKIGTVTEYDWNESGDLTIHDIDANDIDAASLILDTALSPAEGGTGVANNAASTITITGAYALTLTIGEATGVTLPASGTLATLAGTEAFTNKTLTSPKLNEDVVVTTTATKLNYLTGATGTTGTTSTNIVFSTSPTFITPTLGVASATSLAFADNTGILDGAGNEQLIFQQTTTAVNFMQITNSATGEDVILEATGSDSNVDLEIGAKGTGEINAVSNLNVVPKSQYPPAYSDTYVKTTTNETGYDGYYATDPSLSLTGVSANNSWLSNSSNITNQRFHIDLGSAKIVKKIYYENMHHEGGHTDRGANNFTFWGSNTGAGSFDDLVYANDEGWTQLTTSQATFDVHTGSDVADPKYITVTNTTAYRYYAFKFADNQGDDVYMGVRRIELQTGHEITTGTLLIDTGNLKLIENGTVKWDIYNDPADDALQIKASTTLVAELSAGGNLNISVGNLGIATTAFSTNAVSTLQIANGTAPTAHLDNSINIYSVDSSDSTATLGLFLEQAVENIGTFTASHKFKILFNGTEYWIQLDAV